MIDLHTHTTASDGTLSPAELIREAKQTGVTVLGITDHDTFAGYDEALTQVSGTAAGLDPNVELICGIEIATKYRSQSVHLLGYFLSGCPAGFRNWIGELQASREERNLLLVDVLRKHGFAISLEEVRAKGQAVIGRPHFAKVLLEKGYVTSIQEAFDGYLDETADCYVPRHEPQLGDCIGRIREFGGITSLAHPVRVHSDLEAALSELSGRGLDAVEAYHSDHTPADIERFLALANRFGLLVTGGSDFHGSAKPEIRLGTGRRGNLRVPDDIVLRLREARLHPRSQHQDMVRTLAPN